MPTITFPTEAKAQFIAEMPQLNGQRVSRDGATVTLDPTALALLADQPEDNDGHYDGTYVWIGGSEYRVSDAGAQQHGRGPSNDQITTLTDRLASLVSAGRPDPGLTLRVDLDGPVDVTVAVWHTAYEEDHRVNAMHVYHDVPAVAVVRDGITVSVRYLSDGADPEAAVRAALDDARGETVEARHRLDGYSWVSA